MITYTVNGKDFKTFGIWVSDSDGVVDALKLKEAKKYSWPEYHGDVVDLARPRYEARTITLACFLKADNANDFNDRVHGFLAEFLRAGTQRLAINIPGMKPLAYEVYLADGVEVTKKWRSGNMTGTFKLKVVEPEPVKRLLKISGANVGITVTSTTKLSIFWGDGSVTRDVASGTFNHTYPVSGEYYILVAGVMEDVTAFASNAEVVWERM